MKGKPDRLELLSQAHEFLNEVRWGLTAYLDRVNEMSDGGYPSGGTGSGGTPDPTGNQLDDKGLRRRDPARAELREFDRAVEAAWRAASALHRRYSNTAQPQQSAPRMADPGCSLCAEVKVHWCPTYITAEVETPAKKGKSTVRRVPLCLFCYRFLRRQGRVPTKDERQAHAEGRRVRVAG